MKPLLWATLLLCPFTTTARQPAAAGAELPQAASAQPSPRAPQSQPPLQTGPTVAATDLLGLSAQDYINMHLPPLHVLLENARQRSPQVNMLSANKDYEERELKNVRRSWMTHFKLNSSFSYGTNDSSSQIFYEDKNFAPVYNVSGVTQRWWNVGVALNLPLSEIFNRRNRIKQQECRVASIESQVDNWYDEVCLRIIDSYTSVIENLAVLDATARAMITAQAQYASTESDFINGVVDTQVLSRQKNIELEAIRLYEQTRAALNKALLQLEVLSKTAIISTPGETPNQ